MNREQIKELLPAIKGLAGDQNGLSYSNLYTSKGLSLEDFCNLIKDVETRPGFKKWVYEGPEL